MIRRLYTELVDEDGSPVIVDVLSIRSVHGPGEKYRSKIVYDDGLEARLMSPYATVVRAIMEAQASRGMIHLNLMKD